MDRKRYRINHKTIRSYLVYAAAWLVTLALVVAVFVHVSAPWPMWLLAVTLWSFAVRSRPPSFVVRAKGFELRYGDP